MLAKSAFQFEKACPELSRAEREIFARVLKERGVPGANDNNYVYRLYWLAHAIGAKKIVELGATPGTSTLALTFAKIRTGGFHWSCDIGPIPMTELTHYGVGTERWKRFEHTDATSCGLSWNEGLVDFIYLDTAHDLESTTREIEAWLPHLREGGLFVFHDVEACRAGVFRAITNAILRRGCNFEYHHFPDCCGHGVLQWFNNWRFGPNAPEVEDQVVSLSTLLVEAFK